MINDIIITIQPLAKKNRNYLKLVIPNDIGMMNTDITKVRQCIINLLSNSCKFTFDGTISLTVNRYISSGIEIINFTVSDTGIGISEDNLGTLFQAFHQVNTTIISNSGGTGLGLSICQHFCTLLGGSISVESEEGKGTYFSIELPMAISSQDNINTNEDALLALA